MRATLSAVAHAIAYGDWEVYEHFHNDPDNQNIRHGLLGKDGRYDVFRKFSSVEPSLSPILYKRAGRRQVKFVDQYVIPSSIAQAGMCRALQARVQ